jgi:hypothetical protein
LTLTRAAVGGAQLPKVWGTGSGCSPLWGAWGPATVGRMSNQGKPMRLGLEVQLQTQPIQGRLYDRDGAGRLNRAFSGWLGLMSAIEAARAERTPPDGGTRKEVFGEGSP